MHTVAGSRPAGAGSRARVRELVGMAWRRGCDGWSHRAGAGRGGLHPGGVKARPVVDHRPHGVRRRRRDPRPRRARCSPPLADQRDGPHHHRADPGPAAVRRCLHGPAARRRGRYRSAPAAAVRRAAAHHRGWCAGGLSGVSRGRVGGGSLARHHPGPHRRGAGAGGGLQRGRSGADPTGAECRERSQQIHRSPTPGDDAFGLDAAPRRAGECVAGPDLAAVCWSRLVPGSTRSG
jgi:hypothetical protein